MSATLARPERESPRYHIYCDESSQTAHRFIVIGATFVRADKAAFVAERLGKVVEEFGRGTMSELKWTELKKAKLRLYSEYVSTFFELMDKRLIRFRALVIDTHRVNHKLYNEGDPELGFTKFVFTLLYSFAKQFPTNIEFYAFLDERTTAYKPEVTMYALNNKANTELPRSDHPFKTVRFVPSHKSRLIQATDIVIGAIAYETNRHHLCESPGPHKVALMRHVATCARLKTLAKQKLRWPNFDIWHLEFNPAKMDKGPNKPA